MLTADESKFAPRIFELLLQEFRGLGIDQESFEYQTLLKAIRNIFPNNDDILITPTYQLEKHFVTTSVKLEPEPYSISECVPIQLENDLKIKQEQIEPGSLHKSSSEVLGNTNFLENANSNSTEPRRTSFRLQARSLSSSSCENSNGRTGIVTSDWEGNLQYGCPYFPCALAYPSTDELLEHIRTHHRSRRFTCSWHGCAKVLRGNDGEAITRHTMMHLAGSPVTALSTDPTQSTETGSGGPSETVMFEDHPSSATESQNFEREKICSFCSKSFKYQYQLNRHMRTHPGFEPRVEEQYFKCFPCKASFKRKWELTRHCKSFAHINQSRLRQFQCPFGGCGKSFVRRCQLTRHSMTHLENRPRPFKCSFKGCKRAYLKKFDLDRHLRTHTTYLPRTFQCSIRGCEKSFDNKIYLQRHHKRCHPRPFQCSFDGCSNSYTAISSLIRHNKTHYPYENHSPNMTTANPTTPGDSKDEPSCKKLVPIIDRQKFFRKE